MNMLRNLFGPGPKVDLSALIAQGATIVDVRTKAEYNAGHVQGSINIPLDQVGREMKRLKKDKPVITCCASGMRSGSAASMLRANGFDAHNGGPWTHVRSLAGR